MGSEFTPDPEKLRAAAPELYAALDELLRIVNDSHGVVGWHRNDDIAPWGEFEDLVAQANAALAKAEGREAEE